MVAAYVLSHPTRNVSSLVARLMPSTRTPVAIGSSVPAWPTLRVPHRRRHRATTSWLVHPAGLSTMSSPSGVVIVGGGISRGVGLGVILIGSRLLVRIGITGIGGTGCRRRYLGVALLGRQKQTLHMGRAVWKCVRHELQRRSEPDADALSHRRAELALGRLQSCRRVRAFGLATEDGVEHRRILQISSHPDIGDRDETQSLVLDA